MKRRTFLLTAGAAVAAPASGVIMTVRGAVKPESLGVLLAHEHLFSKFGADAEEKASYDQKALLESVVPYAKKIRELGCGAIADATTAYFGRSAKLLRTISEQTGLHILTNTGYYGTANDRYVPKHAYAESADQIARRWEAEWKTGIEGTGIRPGFVKLGVDPGPLSEIDKKLVTAGVRTHLATGLTVAVHTSDSSAGAREQLSILKSEGVAASAWIWVHANNSKDTAALDEAAERGAWISLDGLGEETLERHLELLKRMRDRGRLGQALLSHDGNSFRIDKPAREYSLLFTKFLPRLEKEGFTKEEIRKLTVENPALAFTVKVRKA